MPKTKNTKTKSIAKKSALPSKVSHKGAKAQKAAPSPKSAKNGQPPAIGSSALFGSVVLSVNPVQDSLSPDIPSLTSQQFEDFLETCPENQRDEKILQRLEGLLGKMRQRVG